MLGAHARKRRRLPDCDAFASSGRVSRSRPHSANHRFRYLRAGGARASTRLQASSATRQAVHTLLHPLACHEVLSASRFSFDGAASAAGSQKRGAARHQSVRAASGRAAGRAAHL